MNNQKIVLNAYKFAAQIEHGNGIEAAEKAAKKIQDALFEARKQDKKTEDQTWEAIRQHDLSRLHQG